MSKKIDKREFGGNNKNFGDEKWNEFDCPSCGNPLMESTRDKVKCIWCGTIIIPKARSLKRQAKIYNAYDSKIKDASEN